MTAPYAPINGASFTLANGQQVNGSNYVPVGTPYYASSPLAQNPYNGQTYSQTATPTNQFAGFTSAQGGSFGSTIDPATGKPIVDDPTATGAAAGTVNGQAVPDGMTNAQQLASQVAQGDAANISANPQALAALQSASPAWWASLAPADAAADKALVTAPTASQTASTVQGMGYTTDAQGNVFDPSKGFTTPIGNLNDPTFNAGNLGSSGLQQMENQAIGQGQTLDGVNQSGMNATATLGQDQYPITNQNTGPLNTVPNTAAPPASTPASTGTIGLAGPSPTDLGGMSPLPNPMMPFLNTGNPIQSQTDAYGNILPAQVDANGNPITMIPGTMQQNVGYTPIGMGGDPTTGALA